MATKVQRKSSADILNEMSETDYSKGGKLDAQALISEASITADNKLDWSKIDVQIDRQGSRITLPAEPDKMPIRDAITHLKRRQQDEETEMGVMEEIDAYPLDGAVAFMVAMRIKYGWASPVPKQSFFGPIPPDMLTVHISPDETIQVPWGQFQVPGLSEDSSVSIGGHRSKKFGYSFFIGGTVKKKEAVIVRELAALTREILTKHSIYRGKAIRIQTRHDQLDINTPPAFVDLKHVKEDQLILSKPVEQSINVNIFTLLRETEACRKANIPLKRGVLLAGKYGTGKTLTAMVTAKIAQDNGWTFINLDSCLALRDAIEFARRYQPCVIFAEDIDRAVSERTEAANDILNTLDGALSKNSEIMVVLTTNHVEKINTAMLRPGRLDAVVTVPPPDAEAVIRLIKSYAGKSLDPKSDVTPVGEGLAGNIPAMIREVVERSKLAMISRGGTAITAEDMMITLHTIEDHRALLAPKERVPSPAEELGRVLYDALENVAKAQNQTVGEIIEHIGIDEERLEPNQTQKVFDRVRRDSYGYSNDVGGSNRQVEPAELDG